MVEDLGTGVIPSKLSVILAELFWAVCDDGMALTLDKRLSRGIHSFLDQIMSGVDHILRLGRVSLLGFDQDKTVHSLHSLFSVLVDLYSTI